MGKKCLSLFSRVAHEVAVVVAHEQERQCDADAKLPGTFINDFEGERSTRTRGQGDDAHEWIIPAQHAELGSEHIALKAQVLALTLDRVFYTFFHVVIAP